MSVHLNDKITHDLPPEARLLEAVTVRLITESERDHGLKWSAGQVKERRHLIAQNTRFLV